MAERKAKAGLAGTLDTALLVFVGLVALVVAWTLLKAVLGTVVFFAKLAVLALLLALGIRLWFMVRRRAAARAARKATALPRATRKRAA